MSRFRSWLLLLSVVFAESALAVTEITIWHQMIYSHRNLLREICDDYQRQNPEVQIRLVYRETEELRSSYQAAAMGGSGPDLIYGPSDQVGPFATMGIIRPLEGLLDSKTLNNLDPLARIRFQGHLFMVGDSVGNHLMLIYNKDLISEPPTDTNELIRWGQKFTRDVDGDGRIDRYGLAWNFNEPFFFVPWVGGFGEWFFENGQPQIDTQAMRDALTFVKDLRDVHKIIPPESDYELANSLFKEGRVAMLINGDWSWGDYIDAGIPLGVARIPRVSATGRWPSPLVGTKGYSINVNVVDDKLPAVTQLLHYLVGPEAQTRFTKRVQTMPSHLEVRKTPLVQDNDLLKESARVMEVGRPMPIQPEIRAVWDSLRRSFQSFLSGLVTAPEAAKQAQSAALSQIRTMNEVILPNWQVWVVYALMTLLVLGGGFWSLKGMCQFYQGLIGPNRTGYLMVLPGFIAIFVVIVYPFFYNVLISFSNFSLKTFNDWQLVGFQHYVAVFSDSQFFTVGLKTLIWTSVNIFFHVGLGVFLAVLIDQTLPAKRTLRILLIVPWAVPQYISALTWRGMFHQEYGAINIALNQFFQMSPIQWLSQPFEAFSACILTNVWLGFPFMMIVALGGLQSIPQSLYEAARIDGAGAWARFRHITWPMLRPVMAPAITLGTIWTFNNLNVIWLVSNTGEPADQTHILVSYVYKAVFNLYRYGYGAALSFVIFLILLVFGLFYLKDDAKESAVQKEAT